MSRKKKNIQYKNTLIAMAYFIIFLSSCAAPAKSGQTITFMITGDPSERQAYIDLVEAFHRVYPDIQVEITHIPSAREYRTRLATEFASGKPPDVTLWNYRRYANFAAGDLFEPLGPYLKESDLIQPDDFFPIALEAFTWQGELMCIPQNISSLVVYYNQDLFDAAGIPYPPNDWTWTDFIETAVALTKDFDNDGVIDQYGLGMEISLYRLAPFVWQNGGPIVDNSEQPNRLTLSRPPSLEALQWFVDLHQVHGVIPGRVEETAMDSESRFVAGSTAMFLNSRVGVPSYREIKAFAWNVAPIPRNKTSAGILHSDAYCLSKVAKNKESAWTFIEFANSFEGQVFIARSGRTVPSLIKVAESAAFLDPVQRPYNNQVWLDSISSLRITPVISTWQEIETVASEEIKRGVYGEITTEEAARLAFIRTEEYFLLGVTAQGK
jgi:multiple sugar transport system substrate-binding protein